MLPNPTAGRGGPGCAQRHALRGLRRGARLGPAACPSPHAALRALAAPRRSSTEYVPREATEQRTSHAQRVRACPRCSQRSRIKVPQKQWGPDPAEDDGTGQFAWTHSLSRSTPTGSRERFVLEASTEHLGTVGGKVWANRKVPSDPAKDTARPRARYCLLVRGTPCSERPPSKPLGQSSLARSVLKH